MPRRLRIVVGLILVLLWVPMTAHCQLETVPGFEFLKCNPSETSDSSGPGGHCEDNACASIESGAWKAESFHVDVSVPLILLVASLVAALVSLESYCSALAVHGSTRAGDFQKLWRVTLRTVLAARPPPLAS